jgi:hypothetical protein
MDSPEPAAQRHRFLLVFLLSALMVLSGTHVLETVCHSVGLTEAKPLLPSEKTSIHPDDTEGEKSISHHLYRLAIPILLLFLAYHCLAFREWARRWLVAGLLFDLFVWIIRTVSLTLLMGRIRFTPTKAVIEVVVVLLETALVWVLVHPSTKARFALDRTKGKV